MLVGLESLEEQAGCLSLILALISHGTVIELTSLGSVSGMASSSDTEPPVFLCGSEVVIAAGSS